MLFYLSSSLLLGLTAGVAPGPLLALVVSQTLAYGPKEGMKVSLAPLITDAPIIMLSFFIGAQFTSNHFAMGAISLAGAIYICYLGWECLRVGPGELNPPASRAKSIQKGVLTNFLNPQPYLFWFTVGIPLIMKTWTSGPWKAVLWLLCFYLMLVGSKIGLSMVIGHSRKWLYDKGYIWMNRTLGLMLLFFAIILAKEGIALMRL